MSSSLASKLPFYCFLKQIGSAWLAKVQLQSGPSHSDHALRCPLNDTTAIAITIAAPKMMAKMSPRLGKRPFICILLYYC